MPESNPNIYNRPSPRFIQKYDKPAEIDSISRSQTVKTQRRRRADPARQKKERKNNRRQNQSPDHRGGGSFIRITAVVLIAALLIGLVFSLLAYADAQSRLTGLRTQRQAAEDKHQKELGYYVQMRKVSGFDDYIRQYAQEFSVDRSFISAIISRESHYDPAAQSGAGARGLMQIMPDTGTWVAGKLAVQPYNHDRLFEPELNIRFGAWYLNYLSSQFAGQPAMIAAAFHAGAGNVKQWALKYGEDGKTISADQIPTDDTKDYVKKVMNAYALYYEYDVRH